MIGVCVCFFFASLFVLTSPDIHTSQCFSVCEIKQREGKKRERREREKRVMC